MSYKKAQIFTLGTVDTILHYESNCREINKSYTPKKALSKTSAMKEHAINIFNHIAATADKPVADQNGLYIFEILEKQKKSLEICQSSKDKEKLRKYGIEEAIPDPVEKRVETWKECIKNNIPDLNKDVKDTISSHLKEAVAHSLCLPDNTNKLSYNKLLSLQQHNTIK